MILKTLTPKHLRIFDEKFALLEEFEGKGRWHNFQRGYIAAVWSDWFEIENGNDLSPKSSKQEIINYIDDYPGGLEAYHEVCMEITRIYTLGKQSDLPAKDPNS